jgi:hypothetical protein
MSLSPIQELASVAARAASADNSQPYRLHWNGRRLALHYAERHPEYNVFGPTSHATLLSAGGVIEYLQQALEANGVAPQWQWGSGDGQPYASLDVPDLPAQLNVPPALLQRHTNRAPFKRTPLPADLMQQLGAMREGAQQIHLVQQPEQRKHLIQQIRLCAEARFCTRVLHEWLQGSLRRTPAQVAQGDGLDVACLALPPGGRQLLDFIAPWPRMARLNAVGAYKLLALTELGPLNSAPVLLCLTGPDGVREGLDAGRLLARAWCWLNAQGIAVHPYYVVTDQVSRMQAGGVVPGFEARVAQAAAAIDGQLQLQNGARLHMILRLGYPSREVPRSRRLPLEQLLAVDA